MRTWIRLMFTQFLVTKLKSSSTSRPGAWLRFHRMEYLSGSIPLTARYSVVLAPLDLSKERTTETGPTQMKLPRIND
jgi:hypothetical protein